MSEQNPTWRDDLDEDEQRLIEHATSVLGDWHDGSVDCWRWLKLVVRLVELLDVWEQTS